MPDTLTPDTTHCGLTPREVARLLRISKDRVIAMIRRGELQALDLATVRCRRPRYVILPAHLAEFGRRRAAAAPEQPAPRRRRRQTEQTDYYPEPGGAV